MFVCSLKQTKVNILCIFYTYVLYFIWVWAQYEWILDYISFILILSRNQCLFRHIFYLHLDLCRVYF